MRNPFVWLSNIRNERKEVKLYWVPTLITVGIAITFLGLSLLWALWLKDKLCSHFVVGPIIAMIIGGGFLRWGSFWYEQSKPSKKGK